MEQLNYFEKLYSIDVTKKTEKKNNLTYLSWAWAWAEVKKIHPDANYIVYENSEGWNYFTDKKTCWVKTGVIINGIEHIEYLPVMDFRNKSIPFESVTSFDINKAIQRSLTKAVARHGLGLYIYAGEDLPENTSINGNGNHGAIINADSTISTAQLEKLNVAAKNAKLSKQNAYDIISMFGYENSKDIKVRDFETILNLVVENGD